MEDICRIWKNKCTVRSFSRAECVSILAFSQLYRTWGKTRMGRTRIHKINACASVVTDDYLISDSYVPSTMCSVAHSSDVISPQHHVCSLRIFRIVLLSDCGFSALLLSKLFLRLVLKF